MPSDDEWERLAVALAVVFADVRADLCARYPQMFADAAALKAVRGTPHCPQGHVRERNPNWYCPQCQRERMTWDG